MKILALDPATMTGWAMFESGQLIESGQKSFGRRRGESKGLQFLAFRKWIKDMITKYEVDLVSYERAHYRGGAATELCVGFQTRIQEVAAELGIESAPFHTAEIKKMATGSGRANKLDMITAYIKHTGSQLVSDNEADAYFVGLCAIEMYGG